MSDSKTPAEELGKFLLREYVRGDKMDKYNICESAINDRNHVVLEALLDKDSSWINSVVPNPETLLSIACCEFPESIEMIIEHGGDPLAKNSDGSNALDKLFFLADIIPPKQLYKAARILCNYCPKLLEEEEGVENFLATITHNFFELSEFMLKQKSVLATAYFRNKPVIFHCLLSETPEEYINLFLQYGADINALDREGNSIIGYSFKRGCLPLLPFILNKEGVNYGVVVNGKHELQLFVDQYQRKCPFETRHKDIEILDHFFKKHKDNNKMMKLFEKAFLKGDNNGGNLLHALCSYDFSWELFKHFLDNAFVDYGDSLLHHTNSLGQSVIEYIITWRRMDIMEGLLANINLDSSVRKAIASLAGKLPETMKLRLEKLLEKFAVKEFVLINKYKVGNMSTEISKDKAVQFMPPPVIEYTFTIGKAPGKPRKPKK